MSVSKPHSELFETVRFPLDHPIGRSLGELSDAKRALRNIEEQFEAQRQRVIRACRELEEAGSDPAPLRVVLYALDEDSIPAKERPDA